MSVNILVVDDEPDIRSLVQEILQDEGYSVRIAENGLSAQQAWQQRRPDLVLLDIWMPDMDGISLLKEWSSQDKGLPVPVIMISGHGTVETAVEATRLGAYDFLEKPLSLAKLLLTVKNALDAAKLSDENIGLRRRALPLAEPIGSSPILQSLKQQVQKIAQYDTPVLLMGEAGSGKQIFARYLHSCSLQKDGPFIEVGVATLGSNTDIELFGHEDGDKVQFGLLEKANGGLLFLDEIADMNPNAQAKLLSALHTKSFLRVGGSEPVNIDVRVIAATHRDLEDEVRSGRFREDLYYRLNVVPLHVPPLREHRGDIEDISQFLLAYLAENERLPKKHFSRAAQGLLNQYHWPGNIRELRNLVQRLLILGDGEEISESEVRSALGSPASTSDLPINLELPLREAREQFERLYFQHHLGKQEGNVGKVAKIAGIERTHLYRKIRGLGIDHK